MFEERIENMQALKKMDSENIRIDPSNIEYNLLDAFSKSTTDSNNTHSNA